MAERPFTQADLDVLAEWDTPTICNGLEITSPERRRFGYTVEPMVCIDPKAKPIVGLARVGMIRSTEPPRGKVTDRADWYDYVHATDFPTIAVIQDIDDRAGYGAYWGEVQSTIHKALGSIGCVTNGSFRDLDMWAPAYQMIGGRVGPSHAHVHMVTFGQPVGWKVNEVRRFVRRIENMRKDFEQHQVGADFLLQETAQVDEVGQRTGTVIAHVVGHDRRDSSLPEKLLHVFAVEGAACHGGTEHAYRDGLVRMTVQGALQLAHLDFQGRVTQLWVPAIDGDA